MCTFRGKVKSEVGGRGREGVRGLAVRLTEGSEGVRPAGPTAVVLSIPAYRRLTCPARSARKAGIEPADKLRTPILDSNLGPLLSPELSSMLRFLGWGRCTVDLGLPRSPALPVTEPVAVADCVHVRGTSPGIALIVPSVSGDVRCDSTPHFSPWWRSHVCLCNMLPIVRRRWDTIAFACVDVSARAGAELSSAELDSRIAHFQHGRGLLSLALATCEPCLALSFLTLSFAH